MNSLLPPNATQVERAFEKAINQVVDQPIPIKEIRNIATSPESFLPWLAWERSVEVWNEQWDLDLKRQVIKDSIEIHRRKGTLGAIKRALSSLDRQIKISEWFEYGGLPYTFRAEVEVGDQGLDAPTQREIINIINNTKNVRSHLSALNLVGVTRANLYGAAAITFANQICVKPYNITEQQVKGITHLATGLTSYSTINLYPQELIP